MTGNRRGTGPARRIYPEKGFTLIEVLVATLILGIALTSIHYGQAQGLRAQARTQNVTLAIMLASQLKEEVYGRPLPELPKPGDTEEDVFKEPYERFHYSIKVEDNEMFPGYLHDYNVTISWDSGDKKEEFSLSGSDGLTGKRLEICWKKIVL